MTDAPDPTVPSANKAIAGRGEPPVSPLFEMLPHILRTLRREPALAISLTYLLVAMAGIFYDFSFYQRFDIPVLTLSQIGDFLVAGIQQPMALVLVLSTFPLCWLFDRINMRGRRRRAAEILRLRAQPSLSEWQRGRLSMIEWLNGRRWYTQVLYVVVVLAYGWTFVGLYANHRADAVRRGEAGEVRVWMNGSAGPLAPGRSKNWTYLGAIASYVFVYDRDGGQAAILPVNGIARIEPLPLPDSAKGNVVVAPIP